MPFGMTNSPATFQYFMNDIFHDMTDIFMIIYLDDILIFSKNLDEHKIHVWKAILQWPAPRKVKELQSFLGFANFYWWFINNYSGITKPLNSLLQGNTPWKWTEQCESVFQLLKKTFTTAPILRLFNPTLPIILECDTSDFTIAAIISQFDTGSKDLHPVAFYTHSMINAKLNYNIYNKELLAIVKAFQQWQAYLEGMSHPIQVDL